MNNDDNHCLTTNMLVFQNIKNFLETQKSSLLQNKIFIFPTESVYAIGCCATSNFAVQKIYQIKKRATSLPLLVLVDSLKMLLEYANKLHPHQKQVLSAIGSGEATIILKAKNKLSHYLNIPQKNFHTQSIGFRITSHPLAQKLIQFLQVPIVGTSANVSGQATAYQILEIETNLLSKVDFVLDGGKTEGAACSSLLDFTTFPKISLLRQGKFSLQKLQELSLKYNLDWIDKKCV